MLYKYSEEANERFNEIAKYQNTDMKKALGMYLEMVEEYQQDKGVLAKVYYLAGTMHSRLSEEEPAMKCFEKSIDAGKKSGNVRCQILSLIQMTVLKLNGMNDALAADCVYEALALAIQNHDEDLFNTIYTLLAQIFEAAEDYETSMMYHRKGIEEFVKMFPNADTEYVITYGARILCSSICCIYLDNTEEFEENYKELVRISFGESMPVYSVVMHFMKGYLAYLKGEREVAVEELLKFVEKLPQVSEIMDTYELLTYVYNVFENYGLLKYQEKVVNLMEHYASVIDIWKCRAQCNKLKIRYYKQIENAEQLYKAYDEYYELQQQYHSAYMKQHRSNLLLRKQVFEDVENTKYRIHTLETLSETDMLTGVANRNGLNRFVSQMLPSAVEEKKEWGVVLIDIDRYKGYNDYYGHLEGDECLKQIAKILREAVKGQFCARYGGDEFICVFVGQTQEQILSCMQEVQEKIAELKLPHIKNEPYGIVTVSQGAEVHVPGQEETFEKFVYEADIKLYQCKEKGRNVITI